MDITSGLHEKSVIKERYNLFASKDRIKKAQFKAEHGSGIIGQRLLNEDELRKIPVEALYYFMGATTPTRLVEIQEGQTILDLGCGVGVDAILAAYLVGTAGKVTGIDLSDELIARGREVVLLTGLPNVELLPGDMTNLPIPSSSVDTIISNGAINLVPDKRAVFREAYRVLKPGGKLALGDIILRRAIDPELSHRFRKALAGCLSFAMPEAQYLRIIREAGFDRINVISRRSLRRQELDVMTACPDPIITPPPLKEDVDRVEDSVISIKLTAAKKPALSERV